MSDSLKIQVVHEDDAGKRTAVTDARVTLVRKEELGASVWPFQDEPATHGHISGGFYGDFLGLPETAPSPGEWLLAVTKKGMSPVVQKVTFSLGRDVLQVEAGWGKDRNRLSAQAATISIANPGSAASAGAPDSSTINVLLLPATHLVGLTGIDDGGMDFSQFAAGRRNLLFKQGRLDAGTVSRIFDSKRKQVHITVKSAERKASSWLLVAVRTKTDGKPFSIVDFYAQLDTRGKEEPGSVLEAGIFSHSWLEGPVIVNTPDDTTSTTERAPNDTDARPKDWLVPGKKAETPTGPTSEGPTATQFPSIADAFRKPDGAFRIWGCSHMNNVVAECGVANAQRASKAPRDRFFRVPLQTTRGDFFFTSGEERTTLAHVQRHIGRLVVGDYFTRVIQTDDLRGAVMYAGAAAQNLGIPVFAGPPGLGSLFGASGGEKTFYIDDGESAEGGENGPVFRWLQAEFGDLIELDALRFLNYTKLKNLTLEDPGWRSERWCTYFDPEQMASVLRVASGLEVHRRSVVQANVGGTTVAQPRHVNATTHFPPPKIGKLDGVSGFEFAAKDSILVHLERRGPRTVVVLDDAPGRQERLFVGDDGKIHWLTGPSSIPSLSVTFLGRFRCGAPRIPLASITDGVVEAAQLKCHW